MRTEILPVFDGGGQIRFIVDLEGVYYQAGSSERRGGGRSGSQQYLQEHETISTRPSRALNLALTSQRERNKQESVRHILLRRSNTVGSGPRVEDGERTPIGTRHEDANQRSGSVLLQVRRETDEQCCSNDCGDDGSLDIILSTRGGLKGSRGRTRMGSMR